MLLFKTWNPWKGTVVGTVGKQNTVDCNSTLWSLFSSLNAFMIGICVCMHNLGLFLCQKLGKQLVGPRRHRKSPQGRSAKNREAALKLIFTLVNDFGFCLLIHALKMYLNYNIRYEKHMEIVSNSYRVVKCEAHKNKTKKYEIQLKFHRKFAARLYLVKSLITIFQINLHLYLKFISFLKKLQFIRCIFN